LFGGRSVGATECVVGATLGAMYQAVAPVIGKAGKTGRKTKTPVLPKKYEGFIPSRW